MDCEELCLCSCDPHINYVRQEIQHTPLRIHVTEVASQVLGFIGENLFCFHCSISMQHEHIITTSWYESNNSNSLGASVRSSCQIIERDTETIIIYQSYTLGIVPSQLTRIYIVHISLSFILPPSLGNTFTL